MAKRKFRTNVFHPQNPEKYVGEGLPVSRSSWEWDMMVVFDGLSTVIEWASEPYPIPYHDPITGNQKVYIPDFLVTFLQNGEPVKQMIEIKPMKEQIAEAAKSSGDITLARRNAAKWEAATTWCMRRGIEFVVRNETDLFSGNFFRKGSMNQMGALAQPKATVQKKAAKFKLATARKQVKHRMKIARPGGINKIKRPPRRPK